METWANILIVIGVGCGLLALICAGQNLIQYMDHRDKSSTKDMWFGAAFPAVVVFFPKFKDPVQQQRAKLKVKQFIVFIIVSIVSLVLAGLLNGAI
jgi:hypothetical protein